MTVTEPSGGTVGAPVPITIETALAKVFDHSYERFWRPEMVGERREREVNLVLQLGEFVPGSRVLDLACAFGRLTNALTAKGLHVTGVDISEPLLTIARRDAAAMGIRPTYSWRDMRDLSGLGEYDGVVLWFTSFGYFSETDNRRVLIEALECLRPGGRFLLETRHWDGMPRIFEPTTVRQCGDDYLIEHHSYDAETGIQHTRQTLLSGDQRSQNTYGLRRYGFPELRALCLDVGFQAVRGFDEHGDPLQPDSDRCVLVATA